MILTILNIIGAALLAAPILAAAYDLIVDAPAARATALAIVLTILAIALGAHYHD